jgi:multiple sugar transport system ATP-binding protein
VPRLQASIAPGRRALGVRPEHVRLDDAGALRGRVEAVEYLGTMQIVTLATDHGPLKARTPSGQAARPGETVGFALDAARLTVFDAETGRAVPSAANAGVVHG